MTRLEIQVVKDLLEYPNMTSSVLLRELPFMRDVQYVFDLPLGAILLTFPTVT